ncbi:MAG: UDP-N-acetylmuramoyl-tripeptide--D-alanyl-D-alanine ligase [Ectothiorhodospiraceae bacterium]|nr:UDP-N-acetylmuramoyl-tripeptide--D-alanyl-D-alanine ligase [Ectothiorhodospiraceae bacterium]
MAKHSVMTTLRAATDFLRGALEANVPAELRGEDAVFSGISTDTRDVKPGQLFIALSGPRFDGHDFIAQAKKSGAVGAIVARHINDENLKGFPHIIVNDPLRAYGELAGQWRHPFTMPVVAITGSNGKTTVKEMLAAIFAQRGEVLSTQANFNNEIGVPRTLLRITAAHVAAVVEEGAGKPGDIAYLTHFVRPTVALVTNAASAHLQGFTTLDAVAKTKGEIFEHLPKGAVAVINADDTYADLWREQAGQHTVISFGMSQPSTADVQGFVQDDGQVKIVTAKGEMLIRLPLEGRHNMMNALAATAAALATGASLADISAGLQSVKPVAGRLQRKPAINGALMLDDTYNANPASLDVALDVLSYCRAHRYLALGDMAELGEQSIEFHAQAGRQARDKGVHRLYAVGELSRHAADAFGDKGRHFSGQDQLISQLREDLNDKAVLLVKGSRSSHMERVVDALAEQSQEQSQEVHA